MTPKDLLGRFGARLWLDHPRTLPAIQAIADEVVASAGLAGLVRLVATSDEDQVVTVRIVLVEAIRKVYIRGLIRA
jgi:hypothetical protein